MAAATATIARVKEALEKKYKDSSELFPDFSVIKQIEYIPSPSAIINAVTGIGGLPKGRVTEIYGPNSSGKTTLAIEICVQAQKKGGRALYVDYEHAFDASYGHILGLDLTEDKFVFAQPEYAEQGTEIIKQFVENDLVDIVVIDSAAAMTPKSVMEGELDREGGTTKGEQARIMSEFLSVITKILNRGRKAPLIIINQTRAVINIGRKAPRTKENMQGWASAAGNAIKFYSSMRLELEIAQSEGEDLRGTKGTDQLYTQNKVRITAVKNKLAPPFVRGIFVIEYGKGINNIASIAELAEAKLGIMSGAGFFKHTGATPETSFTCRGREEFQRLLNDKPDLRKELESLVLIAIKEEQAKSLGIKEIKIAGSAKAVEGDTLILERRIKERKAARNQDTEEPLTGGAGLPIEELD